MRVAAFVILCCALQYVASEIIEDKIHNIFTDKNKYETKNVSTTDELDIDQNTGKLYEKQTVQKEILVNDNNSNDVANGDVKIFKLTIQNKNGCEKIIEEDTIIKKVSGQTENESVEPGSVSGTQGSAAAASSVANSQGSAAAASSATNGQGSAAAASSAANRQGSAAAASSAANSNRPTGLYGPNRFHGPNGSQKLNYNIKIVNKPESASSASSAATSTASGKQAAAAAAAASAADDTGAYGNEWGQGITYQPYQFYGNQGLSKILFENKNEPGLVSSTTSPTSGGVPGTQGPSSAPAGIVKGIRPNRWGPDYYDSDYYGNSEPQVVIINKTKGAPGPTSSATGGTLAGPSSSGASSGANAANNYSGSHGPASGKSAASAAAAALAGDEAAAAAAASAADDTGAYGTGQGSAAAASSAANGQGSAAAASSATNGQGSAAAASSAANRQRSADAASSAANSNRPTGLYGPNRFHGPNGSQKPNYNIKIVNKPGSASSASSASTSTASGKQAAAAAAAASAADDTGAYGTGWGQGVTYQPYQSYGNRGPSKILFENKNEPESVSSTTSPISGSVPGTQGPTSAPAGTGVTVVRPSRWGPGYYDPDYYGNSEPQVVIINKTKGAPGPTSSTTGGKSAGPSSSGALSAANAANNYSGSHGPASGKADASAAAAALAGDAAAADDTGAYGTGQGSAAAASSAANGQGSAAAASSAANRQGSAAAASSAANRQGSAAAASSAGNSNRPTGLYGPNRFHGPNGSQKPNYNIKIVNKPGSASSASSAATSTASGKQATAAAAAASAADDTGAYRNGWGQGVTYQPYQTYGNQGPNKNFFENKNKPGSVSSTTSPTSGGVPGTQRPSSAPAGSVTGVRPIRWGPGYYDPYYYKNSEPQGVRIIKKTKVAPGSTSSATSGASTRPRSSGASSAANNYSGSQGPASGKSAAAAGAAAASAPDDTGAYGNGWRQGVIYPPYGNKGLSKIGIKNENEPGSVSSTTSPTSGHVSGTQGPTSAPAGTGVTVVRPSRWGPGYYDPYYYENSEPQVVIINKTKGAPGPTSSTIGGKSAGPSSSGALSAANAANNYSGSHGPASGKSDASAAAAALAGDAAAAAAAAASAADDTGAYGTGQGSAAAASSAANGQGSAAAASSAANRQGSAAAASSAANRQGSAAAASSAGNSNRPTGLYGPNRFHGPNGSQKPNYNIKIVNKPGSASSASSAATSTASGKQAAAAAAAASAADDTGAYRNGWGQGVTYQPYQTYGNQGPNKNFFENKNKPGSVSSTTSPTSGGVPGTQRPSSAPAGSVTGVRPIRWGPGYYDPYYYKNSEPQGVRIIKKTKVAPGSTSSATSGASTRPRSSGASSAANNYSGSQGPASGKSAAAAGAAAASAPDDTGAYGNGWRQGVIYPPYGNKGLSKIGIKNENEPGSVSSTTSPTSGHVSGTQRPSSAAPAGSVTGVRSNRWGPGYYDPYYYENSEPQGVVILKKTKVAPGSTSSATSGASTGPSSSGASSAANNYSGSQGPASGKSAAAAAAASVASDYRPLSSPYEYGPQVIGSYGYQGPQPSITNVKQDAAGSTVPKDVSGTRGPESRSAPASAGSVTGVRPNEEGPTYYEPGYLEQDHFRPQNIYIVNKNKGASSSASSASAATGESPAETPTVPPGATNYRPLSSSYGYGPQVFGSYGYQGPQPSITNVKEDAAGSTAPKDVSGTQGPESGSVPAPASSVTGVRPNEEGPTYYGPGYHGEEYFGLQDLMIFNENEGVSSSASSGSAAAGESPAETPTVPPGATNYEPVSSPYGYGPQVFGSYGYQGPQPSITNVKEDAAGSTVPKDVSGTQGSESGSAPAPTSSVTGVRPNEEGPTYYGPGYLGQDHFRPQNIYIVNKNKGASSSASSASAATGESPAETPTVPPGTTNYRPLSSSYGYGPQVFGSYGYQGPQPSITNVKEDAAGLTAPKDVSGTQGPESGSAPAPASSVTGVRPNEEGPTYYGPGYHGQDYFGLQDFMIFNENEGASSSASSASAALGKSPAETPTAPAGATNYEPVSSPYGYGPQVFGSYGYQGPQPSITNVKEDAAGSTVPKDVSGTQGPECGSAPAPTSSVTGVRPNEEGPTYYGPGYLGQDHFRPQNIYIVNKNKRASSIASSASAAAGESPAETPTVPPGATNYRPLSSSYGYGPQVFRSYGYQGPQPSITNVKEDAAGSTVPKDVSGTQRPECGSAPAPTSSVTGVRPNEEGPTYYGPGYLGQDHFRPQNIYIVNKNKGASSIASSASAAAGESPAETPTVPPGATNYRPLSSSYGYGPQVFGSYGYQGPQPSITNVKEDAAGSTAPKDVSGTQGPESGSAPAPASSVTGVRPNEEGPTYYGPGYLGQDYFRPQDFFIVNENEGASSRASADSVATGASPVETPTAPAGASNYRPVSSSYGYGPQVIGSYGYQKPQPSINNVKEDAAGSTAPRGVSETQKPSAATPSSSASAIAAGQGRKRVRPACRLRRRQYTVILGRRVNHVRPVHKI